MQSAISWGIEQFGNGCFTDGSGTTNAGEHEGMLRIFARAALAAAFFEFFLLDPMVLFTNVTYLYLGFYCIKSNGSKNKNKISRKAGHMTC